MAILATNLYRSFVRFMHFPNTLLGHGFRLSGFQSKAKSVYRVFYILFYSYSVTLNNSKRSKYLEDKDLQQ